MPRQVELDPHDELAFIVENAYHERLVAFLADSKENKKKKIDTNHRGPNGETYIIRCIQGAQKIDLSKSTAAESIKKFELCIKTLVENSFDVNAQDNAGRTPAHWCIIIQNSYLLRVLLLNGADHSIQDAEGQTALHLTIRLSFKDGIIAIGKSCPQAAFEVPSSQSGATPLIYGVQLGKTEIVQTLLEAGCNPNTPENNKYKRTALHYAFFFDHDEIFELLLAYSIFVLLHIRNKRRFK